MEALSADFFADDDWAVTLRSGYHLSSTDALDGLSSGGFGDGIANVRVGLVHHFGDTGPSIYTAPVEGSLDEAAVLATVDGRIAEEAGSLTTAFRAELDLLRGELNDDARRRAGLTHQQVILFGTASADLGDDARGALDELSRIMLGHVDAKALLTGYADARATTLYNNNLSLDRARSALDYLAASGVEPSRMRALGLGEAGPEIGEADALADYRRVEVFIWD